MPLTEKGEKIKSAMEEHYGKEKGEAVFYASENKGNISGVAKGDVMTTMADIAVKLDALNTRFDSFMERRFKKDEFEEAKHPRNAGGTFTVGEGEEAEEDDDDEKDDSEREELRTGALSKND